MRFFYKLHPFFKASSILLVILDIYFDFEKVGNLLGMLGQKLTHFVHALAMMPDLPFKSADARGVVVKLVSVASDLTLEHLNRVGD